MATNAQIRPHRVQGRFANAEQRAEVRQRCVESFNRSQQRIAARKAKAERKADAEARAAVLATVNRPDGLTHSPFGGLR